jgi:hypothetical protein
MPIEDFVQERDGDVTTWHPLLRFVAARLKTGDAAKIELHQPPTAMGYRKAKIYVHLYQGEQEYDSKADDWDDDLNTGLVRLGVCAISADQEKDRFALGLRAAFRKPEKRFGDGYFNAVLVEFVRESDFAGRAETSEVLQHIYVARPHRGSGYEDCRQMIRDAIHGRGLELTKDLGYGVEEAVDLLSGALARYLNERFSVSRRRLLGLL